MEYEQLLAPYGEGGRSLSGQINWLLRKGLPQDAVDYSISAVYKRLELGEVFPDGNALDQELLRVAKEHYNEDLEMALKRRIQAVEYNLDVEWNKLTKWQKIKEVLKGKA